MDVLILGCRVELLRFAPFLLGQTKFQLKIPRLHLGTLGHYLFYLSLPLNEHTPQIIKSIQNSPILLFTLQQLKMRSESWIRGPLPQVFPYHSFSHQLSSSNPFSFQMSWPSIMKCYEEIAKNLTLLCLFLLEEYLAVQALPCLDALQFRYVLEAFFVPTASPDKWGKGWGGVSYSNWSEDEWKKHQHSDPHHWWGVRGT